jgi:hypothetical protein
MFQHRCAICSGAFDTKECSSNTPIYSFKTLNAKTPNHIKLTTVNQNAAMLKVLKVLKTNNISLY